MLAAALSACTAGAPSASGGGGARGRALFAEHCAGCHGDAGGGDFWKGVPPNRRTALDRTGVANLVTRGSPDHDRMPVLDELSRSEALLVADYLMRLKADDSSPPFWTVAPGAKNPR